MDKLNTKFNIILGSKSPRRKELLNLMGLEFRVESNDVLETYSKNLTPIQIAKYLSNRKAESHLVAKNDLIICADTIVYYKNIVLEKPKTKAEAIIMLKKLSNKEHKVVTGVTLKTVNKQISFHDTTTVFFYKLTEKEISYYINNFNSLDKAGAYGIQEWIGSIGIRTISGSFYNVMGMPTSKLYQLLKKLN